MNSKIILQNWRRAILFILSFCPAALSFAGNIQLVSALSGQPSTGGNGESYLSLVSPDGRYVLFSSTANNLVPTNIDGPVPGLMASRLNVFLRDRVGGTTTLVSVNPAGASADEDCEPTGISTNGQFALFESTADNLAAAATNNTIRNIFVRDLINNTTTLVSVGLNGAEGNGNSYESAMTPNGRYVVFTSDATNLVANDINGISDVFVRDLLSGTTTLVSTGAVSSGSTIGSGSPPQITPDGRYVAFCSSGINLAPGASFPNDVYVRDLVAGKTIWASTNARSLYQSIWGKSSVASSSEMISTDGQFVAFEVSSNLATPGLVLRVNLQTLATDLVSTNANVPPLEPVGQVDNFNKNISMTGDGSLIAFVANGTASATNTAIDLWSAQTGTNILVSPDLTSGLPAVGTCEEPVIDPSGQYVAYLSSATNLVTNVISAGYHVYLWNGFTLATQLADADTNGVGVGVYPTAICALTGDGSVYFDQSLANARLAANDINAGSDVLAFHPAAAMELVSGCQPSLPSQTPNGFTRLYSSCVSTNGRFIAFVSQAGNLLGSNTLAVPQIFVRDRMLGANILVSADTNGLPATVPSGEPSISGDGRYVAFSSFATNLMAGVSNVDNVYLRDLQSGTTALVSSNITGSPFVSGNGDSFAPAVGRDGRYILFHSRANNLNGTTSLQSLGVENLYFRDQLLGTNYSLTTGSGTGAIGVIGGPSMTPDGHYVVYSGAVGGNGVTNSYVWNSQTAQLIYTNTLGTAGSAISPDGSLYAASVPPALFAISLTDDTSNLVATGTSYFPVQLQFSADDTSLVFVLSNHIYLHNFLTGTNLLVDRSYNSGSPANGLSRLPAISPNGRFVAYYSTASNIVPNDPAASGNIYLYDWTNNATILASINLAGNSTANYWSLQPQFSGDGNTLAYQSFASDLSSLAFNEFGAVFASDLSAYGTTNSTGTNITFSAQISGLAGAGQSPPNANPVINWSAAPGSSYEVQFTDDLNDPFWQTVNGGMVFVGNSGQIIDLTPSATRRFYRIIAVP